MVLKTRMRSGEVVGKLPCRYLPQRAARLDTTGAVTPSLSFEKLSQIQVSFCEFQNYTWTYNFVKKSKQKFTNSGKIDNFGAVQYIGLANLATATSFVATRFERGPTQVLKFLYLAIS